MRDVVHNFQCHYIMQQKIAKFLFIVLSIGYISLGSTVRAEQMPMGYYDAIQGTKDSVLKVTLHTIIKGGERYVYGPTTYHTTNKVQNGDTIWKVGDLKAYGTWHGFQSSDQLSDGTIWDMYSTTKRYFPIKGGSAAGMDIEHSLPKSWWGGDENDAYTDLYHLNPADRVANNNKSNYPPGILNDSNKVNNGVFFMGKDKEWNDYAFSVIDEYKGDFARAYFYISTAYHNMKWDASYSKYVTNNSYLTFTPYLIQVLLQWHRIDPVSEKEINRLDAISTIQHNRNPFIEYPELVEYIWGDKKGQTVNLSRLVRTTSEEYDIPTDTINPMAYPATEVTENSFVANWKDQDRKEYLLEVFTVQESGKNDTLIAMPGFKNEIVKGHSQIHWLLEEDNSDAPYTLMDGSYAICSSTTTKKRYIRFDNFGTAPAHTYLSVKCCVYKGDQTADLIVRGNNDEILYQQALTLDEEVYTFAIPEGTTTVSIIQKEIGTKSKGYHRISFQQAYLYTGDYQRTEAQLGQSPYTINTTSHAISHTLPIGIAIYYRVTPSGLRTSNTVVTYPLSDTATEQIVIPTKGNKVMEGGKVYILQNNHKYYVTGQKCK